MPSYHISVVHTVHSMYFIEVAYGFYQPKFSISTTNPSGTCTYHISQYVSEIRIEVMNSMTWHHANYSLKFRISGAESFFSKKKNFQSEHNLGASGSWMEIL